MLLIPWTYGINYSFYNICEYIFFNELSESMLIVFHIIGSFVFYYNFYSVDTSENVWETIGAQCPLENVCLRTLHRLNAVNIYSIWV